MKDLKDALKSFEQLDDLDDDVEMVTKEDPMLSAFASSEKTKVKRTLSTESLDSELGSPGCCQKAKKGQKTEKKNIRKIKRRVSPSVPVLELHNSPRIPVVSRPVYSQVDWSTPIGRGPSRLCSDWLDHDVANTSSLMQ